MAGNFSYKDYTESDRVKQYAAELASHEATKPGEYQRSEYGVMADNALQQYLNRDKFSYDLNGDALYQQYKDKYIQQGKMAMQDTMGQAAALTGGYGNSYAATVGNQAYQSSLQNLNDIVPTLYQMAYDRYNQEGQDMLNRYGVANERENQEYGKYRDLVADWTAQRDYLSGQYNTERSYDRSVYDADRNLAYSDFTDTRSYEEAVRQYNENMAYQRERDAVADAQWQKSYALSKSSADQSAKVSALQAQLDNYVAADNLKKNILSEKEFLNQAQSVTRGSRGNTGNGGYKLDGKTYNNYQAYVKAMLNDAYSSGKIGETALNILYEEYKEYL